MSKDNELKPDDFPIEADKNKLKTRKESRSPRPDPSR